MDTNQKEKVAVATGATVGGGAVLSTIAAAGSVTGLGATGITSGLASVGAIVGGGMAAGLAVTVAAPILGGALAYAGYRYFLSDENDKDPNEEES